MPGRGARLVVLLALSVGCAAPTYRRTLITDEIAPYSSPAQVDEQLLANHMCRLGYDSYGSCNTDEHDLMVRPRYQGARLIALSVLIHVSPAVRHSWFDGRWENMTNRESFGGLTRRVFGALAVELRRRYGAPLEVDQDRLSWQRPREWIRLELLAPGIIVEEHRFPLPEPPRGKRPAIIAAGR